MSNLLHLRQRERAPVGRRAGLLPGGGAVMRALLLLLVAVLAPVAARAHTCVTSYLRMGLGDTGPSVKVVAADLIEVETSYNVTLTGTDNRAILTSPSSFVAHDAFLEFFAIAIGPTTYQVDWSYAPTPASGTCSITVEVVWSTINSSGNVVAAGDEGEPISTLTGELYFRERPGLDLGGPLPVRFQRYYASSLDPDGTPRGALGTNWRHTYEWRLTAAPAEVTVETSRGRVLSFTGPAPWTLNLNPDIPFQLVESGPEFLLGDPRTQRIYAFDATGHLVRIEDGKGNTLTLTYAADDLVSVADGLGRQLNLTYTAGMLASLSDGTRTVNYAQTGSLLTSVTGPLGGTSTYAYDGVNPVPGLLTARTLPETNAPYTQIWDTSGRVTSQTDALSNSTSFAYSAGATTVTDPLGQTRVHEYDGMDQFTGFVDEAGARVTLGYDASSIRDSITSRNLTTTTFGIHTASGERSSVTEANGATTTYTFTPRVVSGLTFYDVTRIDFPDLTFETFTYDAGGSPLTATDRGGFARTFTYNARGQALTYENPAGGVTTNTYNSDGTLATRTDPSGNTTSFSHDSLKRLSQLTHADATTASFTYDSLDRLLTLTDEAGHTTTYAYDLNGNVDTLTDGLGATTSFAYDALDRLTTETDPLLNVSSTTYDMRGLVETSTDATGSTTSFTYDLTRRASALIDPAGHTWSRTTDAEGATTLATDPLLATMAFVLDPVGLPTQITDQVGAVATITYDDLARVTQTTDGLGRATARSYDARGRLTGMTTPIATVSYTRDANGNLIDATDPRLETWLFPHDTHGRLTGTTDPLGNAISFTHDNRNRVATTTFPASLGSASFTYNGDGDTTQVSYSDANVFNYTYDPANRLTTGSDLSLTYDLAGRLIDSNGLTIGRDAAGRITSVTLAPSKDITYVYDPRGLPTQVMDWFGGTTTLTYDAGGQLIGITRPNGVNEILTYDAAERVVGISAGSLSSIALVRNGAGEVVTATRSVPLTPSLSPGIAQLSFDAASQVQGFSYDQLGRVTSDGTRSYVWNLASRLISYTEGSDTVDFTYDGLGMRISRTESAVTRSYVLNYAFDLPSISVVREGGGDLRYYVHLPGGQLLYSIEASGESRRFYHYDEIGNTLFLTDDAGTIVASYAYGPYGEDAGSTGAADNPFTWRGMRGVMREGSSLYYHRARYYDSATARFVSRDPIRFVDPYGINPYQYAFGNPQLYADPLGTKFVVDKAPSGYTCHGYVWFDSEREPEQTEAEQIVQAEYELVTDAPQPGDIILYDVKGDPPSPSHSGIVLFTDAHGVFVISKKGPTGDLYAHRPEEYGGASPVRDKDWSIYRRKGQEIDKPTQRKINEQSKRLKKACAEDDPNKVPLARQLGEQLQPLHHRKFQEPETPLKGRTLLNPGGK